MSGDEPNVNEEPTGTFPEEILDAMRETEWTRNARIECDIGDIEQLTVDEMAAVSAAAHAGKGHVTVRGRDFRVLLDLDDPPEEIFAKLYDAIEEEGFEFAWAAGVTPGAPTNRRGIDLIDEGIERARQWRKEAEDEREEERARDLQPVPESPEPEHSGRPLRRAGGIVAVLLTGAVAVGVAFHNVSNSPPVATYVGPDANRVIERPDRGARTLPPVASTTSSIPRRHAVTIVEHTTSVGVVNTTATTVVVRVTPTTLVVTTPTAATPSAATPTTVVPTTEPAVTVDTRDRAFIDRPGALSTVPAG